jgi:hypothetical protein
MLSKANEGVEHKLLFEEARRQQIDGAASRFLLKPLRLTIHVLLR